MKNTILQSGNEKCSFRDIGESDADAMIEDMKNQEHIDYEDDNYVDEEELRNQDMVRAMLNLGLTD